MKKNRITSLLISAVMWLSVCPAGFTSRAADSDSDFSGSGTESDPYKIDSEYKLWLLAEKINESAGEEGANAKYRSAYFEQTVDIDLKNKAWTPIGNFLPKTADNHNKLFFIGHYDGKYHKITNLNCNTENNYAGLFGRIGNNGTDSTDKCVISNLSVYGSVTSSGQFVGGITGELCTGASVVNCSFNGDVSGKSSVGGIAGMTYNGGYVRNCYHNGSVTANENAGGVIGGLRVGNSDFSVNSGVYNSYHTGGKVTASDADANLGGVVGYINYGEKNTDHTITIENNYYLTSTCEFGANRQSVDGCSKLSHDMLIQAAELLGSPYVFNHDASVNDGYPIFEWQLTPYQFKGSGTKDDPYQISSKEELKTMRDLVNSQFFSGDYKDKCYFQTADIDLKNELWTPIGLRMVNNQETDICFSGSYNGNCHSVKGLNINEQNGNKYRGLFGSIAGNGAVEKLLVYGTVASNGAAVGGIAGEITAGGSIRECAFIGNVTGTEDGTGGLAGYLWVSGSIENCYHIGTVTNTGGHNAGGIVGHCLVGKYEDTDITVKNCYNVGAVSGLENRTGSIAGLVEDFSETSGNAFITNCYSIKDDAPATVTGKCTSCDVTVIGQSMLKKAAAELGVVFASSPSDQYNDGYPVFVWQTPIELLNWLLAKPNSTLSDSDSWESFDMNGDGKLDAIDLTLIKQKTLAR